MGGGPAEDIESQTVEDHTDHQHQTVTHLQQGGMERQRSEYSLFTLVEWSNRIRLRISGFSALVLHFTTHIFLACVESTGEVAVLQTNITSY